ncbi:MAG: hypothetical protein WD267_10185 [Balneolales bacterium]
MKTILLAILLSFILITTLNAQSKYMPGLTPVDVYQSLEQIGFSTEKDLGSELGNFWTSTLEKGGISYRVVISSDGVNKIQSIRGAAMKSNRNPNEVRQFFKYLTSGLFLYNNRDDSGLNNWIDRNFNQNGATTFNGVQVKISTPSDIVRIINIDADPTDGI